MKGPAIFLAHCVSAAAPATSTYAATQRRILGLD